MGLADIATNSIHLFQSSSSMAEIFVYDTLKKKCKADINSILTIDSVAKFSEMSDLVNIQPYLAEKWLFIVEYHKVKGELKKKLGVLNSDTSEFFIKVRNYKEFREVIELINDRLNTIYLSVIRRNDIYFLFKEYEISQSLLDFISKAYYNEPEIVFNIVKEYSLGRLFTTKKELVKEFGGSSGTIDSFIIRLLKANPKTEKGCKMSLKGILEASRDLCEVYGVSKFRNFLVSGISNVLDIKMMYIEGDIYDSLKSIPDYSLKDMNGNEFKVFDNSKLMRYNFYLRTITQDIHYDSILRMYLMLKNYGKWYSMADACGFFYKYYEEVYGYVFS